MGKINLKEKSILVLDNGLFFEVALRLADFYGKVYYYTPWQSAYPKMDLAVIGSEWKNGKMLNTFDGKNVERIEEPYSYLPIIDICYCTDIYYGEFAELLRTAGIPSISAGNAEFLETDRYKTFTEMKSLGMDVPNTIRIIGIEKLKQHLKSVKNKWVKISKYRAEFETFHHVEFYLTEPLLNEIQVNLGPLKDITEFIVVDDIEADVEEGIDTYTVHGELPSVVSTGCEIKDTSYAMKLVKTDSISKGNKKVNEKFNRLLKKHKYQGFYSTEVRTTKDNKNYLIDPCCRHGLPSTFSYIELFDNFGEIVWGIANGEMINPIYKHEYGMELLISTRWDSGIQQSIYFPEKYRKNIKLLKPLKIDGKYYVNIKGFYFIASIIATGNSHEECAKKIKEIADSIKGYQLDIKTEGLDEAIEAFNTMEKISKNK